MGKGNKFNDFTYGVGLEITAQSFKQVKDDLKLNLDNLSKMVKSYGKVLKIDPDADISKLFAEMQKLKSVVDGIGSSNNSFAGFVDKGVLSRVEALESSLKTIDSTASATRDSLDGLRSIVTALAEPLKAAGGIKFPATFDNLFGDIKDQSAKIKETTEQVNQLSSAIQKLQDSKMAFEASSDKDLDDSISTKQIKQWIADFKELKNQLSNGSFDKLGTQELEATVLKLSDLGQKLNSALLTLGEDTMKDLGLSLDGKEGSSLNKFLLSIPKQIDNAIVQIEAKRTKLNEQLEQLRVDQTKYSAVTSGQASTSKSIALQSDVTAQVKVTPKLNDVEWADKINDTIRNIEPGLRKVHLTPTFSKGKSIDREVEGSLAQINHAVNLELKVNDNLAEFDKQINNIDTSIKNAKARLEQNGNFKIRFQYEEGGNFKDVAYKIINQLQKVEVHVDSKTSANFIKELNTLKTKANSVLKNISSTIKTPNTNSITKKIDTLRSEIDQKIGNIDILLRINNEPQIISQATLIRDKLVDLYKDIPITMGVSSIAQNTVQNTSISEAENLSDAAKAAKQDLERCRQILTSLQNNGFNSPEFLQLGDITPDGKKIKGSEKDLERLLNKYKELKAKFPDDIASRWNELYPEANGDRIVAAKMAVEVQKELKQVEAELNVYLQKQIAYTQSRYDKNQEILNQEKEIAKVQNSGTTKTGNNKKLEKTRAELNSINNLIKELQSNGFKSSEFLNLGDIGADGKKIDSTTRYLKRLITEYNNLQQRTTAIKGAGQQQWFEKYPKANGDINKVNTLIAKDEERMRKIESQLNQYVQKQIAFLSSRQTSLQQVLSAEKNITSEQKEQNKANAVASGGSKANEQLATSAEDASKKVKSLTRTITTQKKILKDLDTNGINSESFIKVGEWDKQANSFKKFSQETLQLIARYKELKKIREDSGGTKAVGEEAQLRGKLGAILREQKKHASEILSLNQKELESARAITKANKEAGVAKTDAKKSVPSTTNVTKQAGADNKQASGVVKLDSSTLSSLAKDGTLKSIDGKVGQILGSLGQGINITGSNISIAADNVSLNGSGTGVSSGNKGKKGSGGKTVDDEVKITTLSSYSRQLTVFEEQMKRSGLYTDQLKNKIAELNSQLNAVKVKDDVDTYKFDLDRFKEDFEKLKTYDSLYQKFVNSQAKQIQLHDQISTSSGPTEELRQQLQVQDDISRNLEDQLKQYTNLYNRRSQQLAMEVAIKKANDKIVTSEAAQSDKDVKKQNTDLEKIVNNAQQKYKDMQYTMSNFKVPMTDSAIAKFKEYEQLLTTLKTKQQEINDNPALLKDENYSKNFDNLLKQMQDVESKFTNLTSASERFLSNIRSTDDIKVLGSTFDVTNMSQMRDAMIEFANTTGIGTAKLIEFNDAQRTATFEINDGKGYVHQLTVEYDAATNSLGRYISKTKEHVSETRKFINSLKHSFQNVARYITSFGSVYRIFAIIRQGFTYIKDIDSALTELKKVTDETDESYARFLQDMSKTGGVVGATVKDLTKMAAEWSRLGSIIQSAPLYSNI